MYILLIMHTVRRTTWATVNRLSSWALLSLVATAVLAFGATAPAAAQTTVDAVIDRLAHRLEADVAADGIGAISAAVVLGDRVVWARGFGRADRSTGARATDSTVYRVGSISKSLTALLMMLLVERGVLDLDDPIERALPEITGLVGYPTNHPITFRHLATHTGGLIREPLLEGAAAGPMDRWEEQIIKSIPTTAVTTEPGNAYSYSNIGYGILGLAVSRAARRPFMALMQDEIFTPLGMATAGFRPAGAIARHLAAGYVVRRDGEIDADPPAREHGGRGYKVPNGAVYASVYDLAKFAMAMWGTGVLPTAASRDALLTIQTPEDDRRGYGLGFTIDYDDEGDRIAGHGGSVAGYNATLRFDPEARIGVILLRNYNGGATNLGRVAAETIRDVRHALTVSRR